MKDTVVVEVVCSYRFGFGTRYMKDQETSVPKHEVSRADAEAFMHLLEDMGRKRHERPSYVFYDMVEDSNHVTEYIFYK